MTSKKILLIVACWVLLSSGNFADGKKKHKGRHPPKHDAAADSSKVSLWGNFAGNLVYEGCFTLSGQPSKERTDSQNNNYYCNAFCKDEEKPFSATMGVRCLCLDALPSKRLNPDQCVRRCPDIDYAEGRSCGGVGCCGGMTHINAISVFKSGGGSKDKQSSKRSVGSVFDIQGCFDDSQNGYIAASVGRQRTDSANTALRCSEFCSGKGYAVASTRVSLCACTNDLPLARLYEGSDGTRQCNARCAGVFPDNSTCSRDECCGGGSDTNPVYTVFVVGDVDVLKQVLSRIYSNIREDPAVNVLRHAFGDSICGSNWKYFRGSCVREFSSSKTFPEAKQACESMKARLVSFKHEEDMSDFPYDTYYQLYWIGLEYDEATNTWMWATGEPLTYYIPNSSIKKNADSCAQLVSSPSTPLTVYSIRNSLYCPVYRTAYICQRFGKISTVAAVRTSSGIGLRNYTMDMSSPDAITESTPISDTANKLTLSLESLQEEIRKEQSLSSEPLAGYDILLRNKDGLETAQLEYTHQIVNSESTELTISGGMSYTIGIGTEFKTSYFGLAEHKITAEISTTGQWQRGTTTTEVQATLQRYRFTIPVPAGCDGTVAVFKQEIPTEISWRAQFYIEGKVELQFMGVRKAVDISQVAPANDRYVFGFGKSDYGSRPTIVPINTLDCVNEAVQREVLANMRRNVTVPVPTQK